MPPMPIWTIFLIIILQFGPIILFILPLTKEAPASLYKPSYLGGPVFLFFCTTLRYSKIPLLILATPTGLPLLRSSLNSLSRSLLHTFLFFTPYSQYGSNFSPSSLSLFSNCNGYSIHHFFHVTTRLMSWPGKAHWFSHLQPHLASL